MLFILIFFNAILFFYEINTDDFISNLIGRSKSVRSSKSTNYKRRSSIKGKYAIKAMQFGRF